MTIRPEAPPRNEDTASVSVSKTTVFGVCTAVAMVPSSAEKVVPPSGTIYTPCCTGLSRVAMLPHTFFCLLLQGGQGVQQTDVQVERSLGDFPAVHGGS